MKSCRAKCKMDLFLVPDFPRKDVRIFLTAMGGGSPRFNCKTSHRQPRFRRFFSGDGLFSCLFASRYETA